MIKRIDHVAIAVRDLDRAKAFFIGVLGGRELFSSPMPPQKYRWTTIELGSSCFIELLDAIEEDGFVHRFIQKRGEGPHHITIQVDDIEEIRAMLDERGVPTFGFSEIIPGWKEVFVHPRDACGTLIQFAEFNPLDWIYPGYIPRSYQEFAPAQTIGEDEDPIELRRVEGEKGLDIEIRRGNGIVRIPERSVGELVHVLERI